MTEKYFYYVVRLVLVCNKYFCFPDIFNPKFFIVIAVTMQKFLKNKKFKTKMSHDLALTISSKLPYVE